MPTAWLVDVRSGATRTVTGSPSLDGSLESVAIGWALDGRAILQLPPAVCGHGIDEPGIYLVDPATAERTLVYQAPFSTVVASWQKSRGFFN